MDGEVLRNLRLKNKLTQKDLGKKVGLSGSTIRMMELNKRDGSRETVVNLATFFGVSVDFLEGRTTEPNFSTFADDILTQFIKTGRIKDANNIDLETKELFFKSLSHVIAQKIKEEDKED